MKSRSITEIQESYAAGVFVFAIAVGMLTSNVAAARMIIGAGFIIYALVRLLGSNT